MPRICNSMFASFVYLLPFPPSSAASQSAPQAVPVYVKNPLNFNFMNENEEIPVKRFRSQWDEDLTLPGQVFILPSETLPDQSMTIQEIISRYTRYGTLPGSISRRDDGGLVAPEADADPLDDFSREMAAYKAAKEKEKEIGSGDPPAPAPAGA